MTSRMRTVALGLLAAAPLVLVASRPAPPSALAAVRADSTQWVNLQILPDSISHDALMGIMQQFTGALGVRCTFCHVRTGDTWNFPSDEKGHKEIARGMMRMTWQINREILPAIEGVGDHGAQPVTCWTCHRGHPNPERDTTAAPPAPPHRH